MWLKFNSWGKYRPQQWSVLQEEWSVKRITSIYKQNHCEIPQSKCWLIPNFLWIRTARKKVSVCLWLLWFYNSFQESTGTCQNMTFFGLAFNIEQVLKLDHEQGEQIMKGKTSSADWARLFVSVLFLAKICLGLILLGSWGLDASISSQN